MKRLISNVLMGATLCLVSASFTGCNLISALDRIYIDKWAGLVNEKVCETKVTGNTVTYGEHSYTVDGTISYDFNPGEYRQQVTASVTFTNIPSGFNEFKAVYEGLLGKSVEGTVSMVPMAMEIYARSASTGERCLGLLCKDEATVDGIVRILKSKIVPSTASGADDEYIQRYLPAALLKGANYENAYAPAEPYTVEMGPAATLPQETKMTPYGTVYYTYIFADGWDSHNRGVDIFLPKGESLYKVQGCSSCYTQCKTIFKGPWEGLK
ncbi:MAG: hypothetical protein J5737_05620 [Bacteroidales bacterium]|nr:hypothetical protein [Bacteroidales bacterium]